MPLSDEGKKYSESLFEKSRTSLRKATAIDIEKMPSALRPLAEQALVKRGPSPPDLKLVAVEGAARAEALRKAYQWDGQPITAEVIDEILKDAVGYMKTVCSARVNSYKSELDSYHKRTSTSDSSSKYILEELRRTAERLVAEARKEIESELRIQMFESTDAVHAKKPIPAKLPEEYTYHAEVARVSEALFNQGNYRQAVLDAYIHLIDMVRRKTEISADGDDLMNRAMAPDRPTPPPVRFNALATQADRDEQRGIWNLFKGVVGLRNYKAHMVSQFDDPRRAHEYLALASLLMRLLDLAKIDLPSNPGTNSGTSSPGPTN